MDNRNLFNFKFVDRVKERQVLIDFIMQINSKDNILWMSGVSGVGKSFLIKKTVSINDEAKIVYLNISNTETDTLNKFLELLQQYSNLDFIDFLKENYKEIINIAKNITSSILSIFNNKASSFLDVLCDSTIMYINQKSNKESNMQVICNYINNILKKNDLIVVFDNFQYCDSLSNDFFINLISEYYGKTKIKFIIITTDGVQSEFAEQNILENLRVTHLKLKPFSNPAYFKEIFESIFDTSLFSETDWELIYSVCNGIPENLKTLVRNLYRQDAIDISLSKAKIDISNFRNYIKEDIIKFDITKLNISEKTILQILTFFGIRINTNLLEMLYNYMFENMYKLHVDMSFSMIESLNKLEILEIVSVEYKNGTGEISISHDMLKASLEDYFSNYSTKQLISYHIYNFVAKNIDYLRNSLIATTDIESILSKHSYTALITDWENINIDYLKKLLDTYNFLEAVNVAKRLETVYHTLDIKTQLYVVEAFYNVGLYEKAYNSLCVLNQNNIDKNYLFQYMFLLAKTCNLMNEKEEALIWCRKAFKYVSNNNDYIYCLNLYRIILRESSSKDNKDKIIFDKILSLYFDGKYCCKAMSKFLSGCVDYYTGAEAKSLLEYSINIAKTNNDIIEVAYINNCLGYEYVRENIFDKAIDYFSLSSNELCNYKAHESAYPMNNIAVCQMLMGNYSDAIITLTKALLLAKSQYVNRVIKCNLMLCYQKVMSNEIALSYAEQLYTEIQSYNIDDPIILRKIAMNLCIFYYSVSQVLYSKKCLDIAEKYSYKTTTEYRVERYKEILMNNTSNISNIGNSYYKTLEFEPWIITLSHD